MTKIAAQSERCHVCDMKIAEQVTFGGSGLDRAAERRGKLAAADYESADYIILWRGKVLIEDAALVRIGQSHPILKDAKHPPVFLGEDDGRLVFAVDISNWEPSTDVSNLDTFADKTEQTHPSLSDTNIFAELRLHMAKFSARDAELAATAKAILGWHETHQFCSKCGHLSEMQMDGWQRDCPACGAHHFPRTDPVVIMLITNGNSVLLGRSHGWPDGMYSLLAGFIEPGETMEAAVRREVFEEAGIEVGKVGYLASQPWPFPSSLMMGCYGEALNDQIKVDPQELDDALWCTREEMAEVFAGRHPTILPARKGAIAHFLLENWLADRLD